MAAVRQTFEHSYNFLTWILRDLNDGDGEDDRFVGEMEECKSYSQRHFDANHHRQHHSKGKQFSILSAILFIEDDVLKHREFVTAKMAKITNA